MSDFFNENLSTGFGDQIKVEGDEESNTSLNFLISSDIVNKYKCGMQNRFDGDMVGRKHYHFHWSGHPWNIIISSGELLLEGTIAEEDQEEGNHLDSRYYEE